MSPDAANEVWSNIIRLRFFATLYELEVAMICQECRATEHPLAVPLAMGKTTGNAPTAISDINRRSDLFVKNCKEEWMRVFEWGVILSVSLVRVLISGAFEVNMIVRLVAPVALGFAISCSVYAAVYLWRIPPVAKNFPCILRRVMNHPKEYTHVWGVFALPFTYMMCSWLLFGVAFGSFIWTSGAHATLPRDISEPFWWSRLLPIIGMAHPICYSVHVWKTFNQLREPLPLLHQDKV